MYFITSTPPPPHVLSLSKKFLPLALITLAEKMCYHRFRCFLLLCCFFHEKEFVAAI